jgi:uncharacterized protein
MGELTSLLGDSIKQITKQLVDKQEEVSIQTSISTKAVIIQIKVSKNDCGKVIGKKGRTIDALKVLCLAIKNTNFPRDSRRVILEVLEEENSEFIYK